MKQVTIVGVSITGNRGAEAMLTTTVGRIRDKFPHAVFNVFSIYPQEDRKLINDERIRILRSTPAYLLLVLFPLSFVFSMVRTFGLKFPVGFFSTPVGVIAASDLCIDLSGVSFIDSRIKFLPYNILTLLPAIMLGVPVIKGAQAMGPFNKILNKKAAGFLLNKCARVFARGNYTMQYLNELGLNNTTKTTDIAFLHEKRDSLTRENEEYLEEIIIKIKQLKSKGKFVIGISPSSVVAKKAGEKYTEILYAIASNLIYNGHAVLLFPNATRENKINKLHNNDLPVIRKLAKLLESQKHQFENVIFIDKNINTVGIKKLIDNLDAALTSRFHAMVSCLSLCKPVLVIGWSQKYLEIMELFNMEDWVFDYEAKSYKEIIERLESLIEKKQVLSNKIREKYPEAKKLASAQTDYINSFLGKSNG